MNNLSEDAHLCVYLGNDNLHWLHSRPVNSRDTWLGKQVHRKWRVSTKAHNYLSSVSVRTNWHIGDQFGTCPSRRIACFKQLSFVLYFVVAILGNLNMQTLKSKLSRKSLPGAKALVEPEASNGFALGTFSTKKCSFDLGFFQNRSVYQGFQAHCHSCSLLGGFVSSNFNSCFTLGVSPMTSKTGCN